MADPRLKTIKIKTGVVRRLAKEKVVYEKEAETQQQRIEKYKKEGKDEYDIRKQEEVLQESLMMVPDCQRRLVKAYDELKQILDTEIDLKEKEEFIDAKKILEDAKLQLPKSGEKMSNCPDLNEYPNYTTDIQIDYYNYNTVKYHQPPFHTVDPRLNFVNKAPVYVREQVPRIYYPESQIKYDLTLPSPHVEIEQKTDDELYIETWLSKIGKIQINLDSTIEIISSRKKLAKRYNKDTVKLSTSKQSLKKCLNIIKKLESIQEELRNSVETISSAEWKKKTIDIGNLKSELTSLISQFDNPQAITLLTRSINRRKKKRLCQQKARTTKKIEIAKKKKMHKKVSEDIDSWLENMKEEVEKAKMEERMQKDADCVLAEVTAKKSDARKQLSLISALIKLRNIRENIATQRGEKVLLEDRSAFNKLTEKLTNTWEDTMKIYLKEEQCLKLMLETSVKKETGWQVSKSDKIIEQWEFCLFGPKCIPSQTYWGLTSADKNIENFVAIRKSWDTFLVDVNNETGSRIPIGWCLPNINASGSWTKYLKDNF